MLYIQLYFYIKKKDGIYIITHCHPTKCSLREWPTLYGALNIIYTSTCLLFDPYNASAEIIEKVMIWL